VLCFISAIVSYMILFRMWRVGQFTNYIVSHAIWIELITTVKIFVLMLNYRVGDGCLIGGLNVMVWISTGTFVFIARLPDNEFRKEIRRLLGLKKVRPCRAIKRLFQIKSSFSCSEVVLASLAGKNDDSLFGSFHKKFIIDALVSLSFYFVRNQLTDSTINSKEGSEPNRLNEECYTIEADIIKEVVQHEQFNTFFNSFTAYKYNIIEYFPSMFKALRSGEGITEDELMRSLSPLENLETVSFLTNTKGGSSGAFIYKTHDDKYIIKTITTEEKLRLLNKLLPSYLERIFSRDSALAKILGVFQIQCVGNYSTNLVIMENASLCYPDVMKFDLKGSTYNRRTDYDRKNIGKDCNFIEKIGRLKLSEADRESLTSRLSKDTHMLASKGIMDYSLLVTITTREFPTTVSKSYIYVSSEGPFKYIVALIDYLQDYDVCKRGETFWKTVIKRVPVDSLSSISPIQYRARFMEFLGKIL